MPKKSAMKIVVRNIDELIAAEYNPRKLSGKQFQTISDSIKRFGLVDPIIINKHKDRNDIIVGGHQRVKVAREMGIVEVPTVEVNLTLDKERELNVRLNKNSAEWNYEKLAEYFVAEELTEWGFEEVDFLGDEEFEQEVSPLNSEGEFPFSIELDDKSNYVVLKFDKDIDFLQIQTLLGLESVYSKRSNGKPWSKGIGRVVDGVRAIKRIQDNA